jgi:hypothetical protein
MPSKGAFGPLFHGPSIPIDPEHGGETFVEGDNSQQKTRQRRVFLKRFRLKNYFSLISLYSTCLRALGSNFMIDIFSGIVFLFLLVV